MTFPLGAGLLHDHSAADDDAELRALIDDIGRQAFEARTAQRGFPDHFDAPLWRNLEQAGLSRLTSGGDIDAGAGRAAMVLHGIARHAGAVPLAETDLLGCWLLTRTGAPPKPAGTVSAATAHARLGGGRLRGSAEKVPWARCAEAIALLIRSDGRLRIGALEPADITVTPGHNLAGEPRDTMVFDLPADRFAAVHDDVIAEFARRGAWARSVQIVGALDAAVALSVRHTTNRIQFGRPLSTFQAVQHTMALLAGEVERARAATTLAIAAADEYGFDSARTDFATSVAKVVTGRAAAAAAKATHQLHGAIGVTMEHPLWLFTRRILSWASEYGTTVLHAQRIGHIVRTARHHGSTPWDVLVGTNLVSPSQVPFESSLLSIYKG